MPTYYKVEVKLANKYWRVSTLMDQAFPTTVDALNALKSTGQTDAVEAYRIVRHTSVPVSVWAFEEPAKGKWVQL